MLQALVIISLSAPSLLAADGSWRLNASGGLWSDIVNWSPAPPDAGIIADGIGSTATFGGAGNNIAGVTTVHLDSDRTLTNLSFTDNDPATPGSWILDDNGVSSNNLILAGTTPTITVNIAPTGTSQVATISAIIEGTDGLTKKGTGTLILSAANTYSGAVVIGPDSNSSSDASNGVNNGILAVTNAQALGTGAITINGRFQNQGKIQLSNDIAITTAGNITCTNSRQAIGALGGGGTGPVGGIGTPALGYANIENLSGNNSLNSNITIANGGGNGVNILSLAGTLTLTGSMSSGGSITSSRTYSFAGAGDIVVSGTITNGIQGISVTKENSGTLTLSGTNTYVNATTIAGGTISVDTINDGGVAGNLGASAATSTNLIFNNGTLIHTGATETSNRGFTIRDGTTATIETTNILRLAGANGAATTGSLTKTGPGGLTLTGTNSYTGTTTISSGTLQIGNDGTTGSLSPSSTIVNDGTFSVFRSDNVVQGTQFSSAPISGTGGFSHLSTASVTLNVANTYTGNTLVTQGTLVVTNPNFADTSTVTIGNFGASPAILNLPNAGNDTIASLIIDGVPQASGFVYGNSASVLPVIATDAITGPGTLTVTTAVSDYDSWIGLYPSITGDDKLPTADPDNDGLVNQQEFAFGLIPNSGASVNPITIQLDNTSGTFSYQRRATTGLTYKILTSTDLVAWPEDTTATLSQVPGPVVSGNQTVVVTLTGVKPLTDAKLFVRVAAQ